MFKFILQYCGIRQTRKFTSRQFDYQNSDGGKSPNILFVLPFKSEFCEQYLLGLFSN